LALLPLVFSSSAFAEGMSVETLKCPMGAQEMGDGPPDGNLIYCARIIPGKTQPIRHGPFTAWYRTGELKKRGGYLNGKLDGRQIEYYANGTVKEDMTYVKGGVLDGEHTSFFENGGLELREHYKNGKLDGHKEQNYRNGNARSTADYKDGSMDGIFVLFHQNGQPRVRGFYHNHERSGTWTTFWDDGAKRLEGQFTAGASDGTWTKYSRKGNPITVSKFEMGTQISKQRYKPVEERPREKGEKGSTSYDDYESRKFSKWNSKVKHSLRQNRKERLENPEYIPRDEKQRLAMERRKEYKEIRAAKKKAARDREIDAVLDTQKSPFNGMFAVGKKRGDQ
jgi:antitoxin component YwqK of YwqJK toxin-antitoxin module